MHLRLQLRLPLIVLTIVDLCLSLPNFPDTKTIADQNNVDVSRPLNKYHKFNSNRQSNVINTSDDDIHKFNDDDKQKSNTIRRNGVESAEFSMSFDEGDDDAADISDDQPINFLITNFLSDGEIERRIHFNGITAKETLVVNSG